MKVEHIAQVVHEAIRAYQSVLGQPVSPDWASATWEKDSSIEAVKLALADPSPGRQHELWMQSRIANGWKYGEVKDNSLKTNPTLVPFDKLPASEKAKDSLVISITQVLSNS